MISVFCRRLLAAEEPDGAQRLADKIDSGLLVEA
jgi:hypothetical protein